MIDDFVTHRLELENLCQRMAVSRLEVFGSAATGPFRDSESDIDLLVEFESPEAPGYADRYFGLLEALETMFGRPVDLVVASAIENPFFRDAVQLSKVLLYAA